MDLDAAAEMALLSIHNDADDARLVVSDGFYVGAADRQHHVAELWPAALAMQLPCLPILDEALARHLN